MMGPLRIFDERVPRPEDRAGSGDNGAGEWLRISEELHREFNARTRAVAVMDEPDHRSG
jgi:hypothetical protein